MQLIIRHCSTCNKNFHSYNYSHGAKGTVEIEAVCLSCIAKAMQQQSRQNNQTPQK